MEELISENSVENDRVVFTDGSVKKDYSAWTTTMQVNGIVVAEVSDAVEVTMSSMQGEIKAITESL